MNTLFITKGDTSVPSSNFRVWVLRKHLEREYGWTSDVRHGIAYRFWSLSRRRFAVWRNILTSVRVGNYDLLFVHKTHFPFDIALLIILLKYWYGLPVVYDVDDPQWRHSWAQDWIMSRIADKIFASSQPFFERYKKINKNVVFIPTVVEYERYAKHKTTYRDAGVLIIGWVGSGKAHFEQGSFGVIRPALEALGRGRSDFVFRVVGSRGYEPLKKYLASPLFRTEFIDSVPFDDVPKTIAEFDVGVAPVPSTEWFEINATAKGVEYMAVGVPTVASNVGAYRHLIQDGENGFRASTAGEWVEKLIKLMDNKTLRQTIGEAGMAIVREKYSYTGLLPTIKKEIESMVHKSTLSYHFSIDDVFDGLFDASLFPFLDGLHERYDADVDLYLFYEKNGKTLKDVPDLRAFCDERTWLRFGPHALNYETAPYDQSPEEQIKTFQNIYDEIDRFAGKAHRSKYARLHYFSEAYELAGFWKTNGVQALFTTDKDDVSWRMDDEAKEELRKNKEVVYKGTKFIRSDFRVENMLDEEPTLDHERIIFLTHESDLRNEQVRNRVTEILAKLVKMGYSTL